MHVESPGCLWKAMCRHSLWIRAILGRCIPGQFVGTRAMKTLKWRVFRVSLGVQFGSLLGVNFCWRMLNNPKITQWKDPSLRFAQRGVSALSVLKHPHFACKKVTAFNLTSTMSFGHVKHCGTKSIEIHRWWIKPWSYCKWLVQPCFSYPTSSASWLPVESSPSFPSRKHTCID